ncbi:MAG: transporter substrate-binding domain-containing protein [Spirochaetales bacterium]|nr:transporter substrate-binding domain-containing protein [Spirochaetales bacterium]
MRPRVRLACAIALALSPACFAPPVVWAQFDAPERYEIVRVAVDASLPPLRFESESGVPAGFFVDVINAIGQEGGMGVALYAMGPREARAALEAGEVDAILGVPYSAGSASASPAVALSEPIFASAIAVVSAVGDERYADGVARLADGVLALTAGSPAYDFLKAIRAVRFNETSRPADALELLALGRADAFLEDRAVASYLLRGMNGGSSFELASSYWLPVEYGVAVRDGDDYLLYRLNQGLGAIKESGAYSAAFERWFDDSERLALRRLRNALAAFAAALAVLVLGGGGSVWWNRQLASRVRSSTAELRAANEELERLAGEAMDRSEFIVQVLESSPRGLVTCGIDGVVATCNARGRAIGLLEPDPVGRHYSEYPFLVRFLEPERLGRVLGGETFAFETVEWTRPDGKKLHIRNGLYPQVDHASAVVGIILSFEDHTNEKAILERLAEREKGEALGRIVAGVAHEIRNPLTAIKAFVELLPRKMDDKRFLGEMGAHVPREVERMDALIRDLIDFSRPRTPRRAVVDLGALMESCVALAAPSLGKRGVLVVTSVEQRLCASIDADQVRQCAMNLILNAADALEEGGADRAASEPGITVRVLASGRVARVEIADRGPGIDAATLARVFEPFYTTKRGGVGLGLPLSRQYVEENGGRLLIDSVVGTGTTVTMEFPLEPAAAGEG